MFFENEKIIAPSPKKEKIRKGYEDSTIVYW
jgi:hypothetical protein